MTSPVAVNSANVTLSEEPNPMAVRALLPETDVQVDPLATMMLPEVTASPAMVSSLALHSCTSLPISTPRLVRVAVADGPLKVIPAVPLLT